jgi:hypothetical protein
MPNYSFKCLYEDEWHCPEFVVNLPIDKRDDSNVQCPNCKLYFTRRVIRFNGSVWAPTAGGMR